MQEGSTQGRSALVFQALLLLSAVFALDLRGSYKVGELRAHTLMATCVGGRSGTVPPLLRGAYINFTGVPFLPVESCLPPWHSHHPLYLPHMQIFETVAYQISVTAAQDTKRHIKFRTNSQPYRLSFPSEEFNSQFNTTHFQRHPQACCSACCASSPFTHFFYSLSCQH